MQELLWVFGPLPSWARSASRRQCRLARPRPRPRDGWRLVWSDEFDYTGLPDPKKWDYEEGFVRNNEAQYYTRARKENARVENGMLVIEGRKEKFPVPQASSGGKGRQFADYTAASLITLNKADWKFGRIEVRAKLPQGRGVWPAIWMLGSNIRQVGWPACGEIDIMEFVGHTPGFVHATVHFPEERQARLLRQQTRGGQTVGRLSRLRHGVVPRPDGLLLR